MKVAITGSHGLIGAALVRSLTDDGHQVTQIVRPTGGDPSGKGSAGSSADTVAWDPKNGTIDHAGLEGHDAVVHLAGAGIGDHRWTTDYKAAIRDSRVHGTRTLAECLATLDQPPSVLASGSAVGFYGPRGDEELTEESGGGGGFLAGVVADWEGATSAASAAGIRVAHLRSGVVLSALGGALARQLPVFRLGLGGKLGSGRQYLSWISLEDEVAAIRHVIATAALGGPVNLTAPHPVTNAEFTRALGRVLHRPAVAPVPTVALNLAFGKEMVSEMLLGGQRAIPAQLTATGFTHGHPELEEALAAAVGRSNSG